MRLLKKSCPLMYWLQGSCKFSLLKGGLSVRWEVNFVWPEHDIVSAYHT